MGTKPGSFVAERPRTLLSRAGRTGAAFTAIASVSGLALVVSIAATAGCAGAPSPGSRASASSLPLSEQERDRARSAALDADAALERLAQRQQTKPDPQAEELAALLPPTGAMENAPAPASDLRDLPLTEAIDRIAAESQDAAAPQPQASATDIPDQSAIAAQQAYARARALLQDGDTAGAIAALDQALRADPTSAELLSLAGRAHLAAGRRSSALALLRRAEQAGTDDATTLILLAREEARLGQTPASVRALRAARRDDVRQQDPSLWVVLHAELAEALAARGAVRGALEAIGEATSVDRDTLAAAASPFTPEADEVLRRRGSLLTQAGDLALASGDLERAENAYAGALRVGGVDASAARARLLRVLTLRGRTARAAQELLAEVRSREGAVQDWHVAAARALSRSSQCGELLRASASGLRAEWGGEGAPRSARVGTARLAGAAAEDADTARALLADAAAGGLFDRAIVGDMLALLDPSRPHEWERVLTRIVTQDPLAAGAVADAILMDGRAVDEVSRTMGETARADARNASAALLAGVLHARLGRTDEALELLTSLDRAADERVRGAGLLARVSALAEAGRPARARELARAEAAGVPDARTRALVLDAAGMHAEAREALGEAAPEDDVDTMLLRAQLAARARAFEQTRAELLRAIATDPSDERAYEPLLALHQPGGPLADPQLLAEVARDARRASGPAGLAQWVQARELFQRGALRQAQAALVGLISETGEPPEATALLVQVLEQAAQRGGDAALLDEGERLLRERLAARPQSATWLLALSRLLVARKESQEALSLLETRLQQQPTIHMLRRQREFVLRDGLGRGEEADALTLARLEEREEGLETAAARAEVLVRRGRAEEALAGVLRGMEAARENAGDDNAELTQEQARSLAPLLSRLRPELFDGKPAGEARAAVLLIDAAQRAGVRLGIGEELTRVDLATIAYADDADALLAEIDGVSKRQPTRRGEAIVRSLSRLNETGKTSTLLRIMGAFAIAQGAQGGALLNEWAARAGAGGEAADVAWVAQRLPDVPTAQMVLGPVGGREPEKGTLEAYRAELAYTIGNYAHTLSRDQAAKDLYRLALEHDPRHAWAANNLGYMILERGGDLQDAARLIEQAFAIMPEEVAIIDSLGWLRYEQGRIDDDARGPGAITLLERAIVEPEAQFSAEILDHLADALWRRDAEGDRDRAIELWKQAEALLDEEVRGLAGEEMPLMVIQAQDSQEHLQRVRSKRVDAEAGKEPGVEPIGVPETFTPRPVPEQLLPRTLRDGPAQPD